MEFAVSTNASKGDGDVSGRECDAHMDLHRPVDADLERGLIGAAIDPPLDDAEVDLVISDREGRLFRAPRLRQSQRACDDEKRAAKRRAQCRAAGVGDGEAWGFAGSTKRDAACSWIRTLRYVTPAFGWTGMFVRVTVYPPT